MEHDFVRISPSLLPMKNNLKYYRLETGKIIRINKEFRYANVGCKTFQGNPIIMLRVLILRLSDGHKHRRSHSIVFEHCVLVKEAYLVVDHPLEIRYADYVRLGEFVSNIRKEGGAYADSSMQIRQRCIFIWDKQYGLTIVQKDTNMNVGRSITINYGIAEDVFVTELVSMWHIGQSGYISTSDDDN